MSGIIILGGFMTLFNEDHQDMLKEKLLTLFNNVNIPVGETQKLHVLLALKAVDTIEKLTQALQLIRK